MVQPEVRALGSRYQLDTLLGSGAMGQVWLARDLRTKDKVAAKLLREEYANDAEIVTRFVQERSILIDLKHPHIVAVRDLVVDGGDLGIVMDLVEGTDVRKLLTEQGTLLPAEAARITADVLEALSAAHARHVFHRDVKPDNVLLDGAKPPFVRLTDFGIARLAGSTTVKMTGILGTPEYLAPEIIKDKPAGAAVDVYGAGVMLYELLVARTPFADTTRFDGTGSGWAIAHRIVGNAPPRIRGVPRELWLLLDQMLAKEPTDRPTATAAAEGLRALLPALADVPRLAPMAAPPDWEDAVSSRTAVRALDGTVGPTESQGTVIKGDRLATADSDGPLAGAGAAALAGSARPDLEATQTIVAAPRAERKAVDTLDLATPDAKKRSRLKVAAYVLGGLVLAGGLGVGGFLLLGHKSGSHGPGPAQESDTINGSPASDDAPYAGLTVTRTAVYSKKDGTLTLTVDYASSGPTLTGPFFESVPSTQAGAPCPVLSWSAQQDTVADPKYCGWSVTVAAVEKASHQTASYTIPWTPPKQGDTAQALAAYASAEGKATDAALATIQGTASYPVQRLESVEVTVVGSPTVSQPITVNVLPQWVGNAKPDATDVLYDPTANKATTLATPFGGLTGPTVSSECTGAITTRGGAPHANAAAQGCTLSFAIGGQTAASSTFDIGNFGSPEAIRPAYDK